MEGYSKQHEKSAQKLTHLEVEYQRSWASGLRAVQAHTEAKTPTETCAQNRQTSDKKDNGTTSSIKTRNMFSMLEDKE